LASLIFVPMSSYAIAMQAAPPMQPAGKPRGTRRLPGTVCERAP
jgi:hypothetical protein